MSILAFLYALIFQMGGSTLQGNAWIDRALDLTVQNLWSMQGVLGIVAVIALVVIAATILFSGGEAGITALGCFGSVLIGAIAIWVVGWLHILLMSFLANNFTPEGAANPGFWILLVLMVLASWS